MNEREEYALNCLREFITQFEMKPDIELWLRLTIEEGTELLQSVPGSANELKEAADFLYTICGTVVTIEQLGINEWDIREPTRYEEAITDAAYQLLNELSYELGPEVMEEAFKRVHASNMSKLDDNGKPIRREDGKIMKGPNYEPPYLDDLVEDIE